jgi:hypothetical protein
MKRIMRIIIMATLLLTFGVTGFAAEPKGLKVELMPYLWYAGLEGDLTLNGTEYEFSKSPEDVFEAVSVAGSFLAVLQYNRFLLWYQGDYFNRSTDELDIHPANVSIDSTMILNEVAVGYQIDGFFEGQTFDLMVGARFLNMENELIIADHSVAKREVNVADPMLVIRPSIPLFPSLIKGLRFNPTLAIGGGGDSELVFELFPQLQYQFTDNIAMRIGYRTVGYKFTGDNNEDNELNLRLAGLIVGIGGIF